MDLWAAIGPRGGGSARPLGLLDALRLWAAGTVGEVPKSPRTECLIERHQASLRETADFFRRVRFSPAVASWGDQPGTGKHGQQLWPPFLALGLIATRGRGERRPSGASDLIPSGAEQAWIPRPWKGLRLQMERTDLDTPQPPKDRRSGITRHATAERWFQCVYAFWTTATATGSTGAAIRTDAPGVDYITVRMSVTPASAPCSRTSPRALGIPNPVADGYLESYQPSLMTRSGSPARKIHVRGISGPQIAEVIRMYRRGHGTNSLHDRTASRAASPFRTHRACGHRHPLRTGSCIFRVLPFLGP
jgi:hypothetical protein